LGREVDTRSGQVDDAGNIAHVVIGRHHLIEIEAIDHLPLIPLEPPPIILPRAFLKNGVMVDRTTIARRARRAEVQGCLGPASTEPMVRFLERVAGQKSPWRALHCSPFL
jgi:hypothetical protein